MCLAASGHPSYLRAEHEVAAEALAMRMVAMADAMAIRRETVEHPSPTIKAWMGCHPLPVQGIESRPHGDEPACPGV